MGFFFCSCSFIRRSRRRKWERYNPLSYSWCQEKLGKFLFCSKRLKITKKIMKRKTRRGRSSSGKRLVELLLMPRAAWWGFFSDKFKKQQG
jgi:hypothetical protein